MTDGDAEGSAPLSRPATGSQTAATSAEAPWEAERLHEAPMQRQVRLALMVADARDALDVMRAERDRARDLATGLAAEIAQVHTARDAAVAQLAAVRALAEWWASLDASSEVMVAAECGREILALLASEPESKSDAEPIDRFGGAWADWNSPEDAVYETDSCPQDAPLNPTKGTS